MAGGSWDPTTSEIRPGLYINFVEAAVKQITGGPRGVVALPLFTYDVTAQPKTFYTIENEKQAAELFGADNIQSIKFALMGGAKEVLVYTMPPYDAGTVVQDYIDMREAFDTRPFNVFVFDGEVTPTEQQNTLSWVKTSRDDGKHFMAVFGGSSTDDQDPAVGDNRSQTLKDDYVVNVTLGVKINGVEYNSSQFAPFVAGLIAGTPINKSITYAEIPVDDVTKRLTNSQIKTALQAGSLVLVHDGEVVRVERGITTSGKKIRTIRARQAIASDITKTAASSYIGKVDNNVDGQKSLVAAIKAYLEKLAAANVITNDISVMLDPQRPSVGDSVYLVIRIVEVDSMEEIYLTINV